MNHKNNPIFLILFILIAGSGHPENTRINQLIFLPLGLFFIPELLLKIFSFLILHEFLFNFCLHILGPISLIQFLLLLPLIIDKALISIIPIHLSFLLSFFPGKGIILKVLFFIALGVTIPPLSFLVLGPGQNLRGDLIHFLGLEQRHIAPENGGPRAIGPCRCIGVLGLSIISRAIPRLVPPVLSAPVLGPYMFR